MPPSLPHISGADAIRALQKLGFVIARRGSTGCVVPNHREIKSGTLSGVLKQAGVPSDEFMSAL